MEGRVGERKEGLAVKREEGGGAWADVDVGTEKVVDGEDGEDGEGEWKGKLATPGLWDEGFEELEGRGGDGIRQEHQYRTRPPKPITSPSSLTVCHNQHLPLSPPPLSLPNSQSLPPCSSANPLQYTTYFALRPRRYRDAAKLSHQSMYTIMANSRSKWNELTT